MVNRKPRSEKSKTLWDYLFFNPRAVSSFDTWCLIFESHRLCRRVDREMKRVMTPEQYREYLDYGKQVSNPETKPVRKRETISGILRRLFRGSR
jgi:hypothetical protein